uniref:U8-Liphistoxin-Lm1a_1 n=1 Tax=Liphistius malayanus TaxID=1203467 RepID=A0A482Z8V8_9ARAC
MIQQGTVKSLAVLAALLLLQVAFADDCEKDGLGTCTLRRHCEDADVIRGKETCSGREYGLSEVCCRKVPRGISVCERRGGSCLEYCSDRVRIPGVTCSKVATPACCIMVN